MLGSLATWLRIFGVDTVYPSNTVADDEILQQAKKEGRVLLTRDKLLAARGKREGIPVVFFSDTDLGVQLQQAVSALSLDASMALSRCTICNNILKQISAKEAQPYVPPRVFARQTRFWFCAACQKYYWMGTHYEEMEKKIKALVSKTG
jgi:uncharacterized protein